MCHVCMPGMVDVKTNRFVGREFQVIRIVHKHNLIFFIYSQIRKSGILDTVVINAEDTDTVVLSAFVTQWL